MSIRCTDDTNAGKTFAWQASFRDHNEVDWTMPDAHDNRRVDELLQTGGRV